MRCASALSTTRNGATAIREVLDRLHEGLSAEPADLIVVFASPHHADDLPAFQAEVLARGMTRHLLGATGESIVGEDREIEGPSALAAWALRAPGVQLQPIRINAESPGIEALATAMEATGDESSRVLLLLGDPFSFPADGFLKLINDTAPGLRLVGGMASGGPMPGSNRLVLDDAIVTEGAVAMLVSGPIEVRTVVSQGCRPIGRPLIVTRVEQNLIHELGRRPSLDVFREMYETLEPEDRDLVREGLHIGRVINEYQGTFGRGDFLVRNVMGADESGAIGITDVVRVGQTVQFHVRDAATADEDLRHLLSEAADLGPASGALMFTCNGRGTRLFSAPDHDVAVLHDSFGPIPVAGFFAMGEIGPIGGQNFVHGFTASLAIFANPAARNPDATDR
jgi:small ligand-binding sensory domain FIST